WSIPKLIELLTEVVPKDTVVEDFEVKHSFPKIGEREIVLNARKVFRKGNHTHMLLLAMQDITVRRRIEAEREAALEHAGRLLEEINHRVMNSLTMIAGVISLEARNLSDETCKAALARIRSRVDAIGRLYKTLSRSGSVDSVGTRDYLTALASDLISTSEQADCLSLSLELDDIPLSTEVAVPLGLVVNELITNSIKYAYNGRSSGSLAITLRGLPDRLEVKISDDGPGIDPNARVDSGLGQKLTEAFMTQLGGVLITDSNRDGTTHAFTVPLGATAGGYS
ncbi:sensor histidine kinase, partial [Paracoccus fontiphilus]